MKLVRSLALIAMLIPAYVFGQCTADPQYTQPGIYPDFLPNVCVGTPYSETITAVVPTDTTVGGIPVTVVSIELSQIFGLPPGFTLTCNPSNCVMPGGGSGCAQVTGTAQPGDEGTYVVSFITVTSALAFGFPVSQTDTVDSFYVIHVVSVNADAGSDETINQGSAVMIGGAPTASGGHAPYAYNWNPATGLNSPLLANPMASPAATTTYMVTVQDSNGCSDMSSMMVTVNPAAACDMPTGLFADKLLPKKARLNWTPSAGADHYRIQGKRIGAPNFAEIFIANPAQGQLNIAGLSNGQSYIWQIQAYCDALETSASGWSAFDTFTAECITPDSTWTSGITPTAATFNWNKVQAVFGYVVRARKIGGGWTILQIGNGNTTSRTVSVLSPGKNYEWQVAASCNANGTQISPFSPSEVFSTPLSRLGQAEANINSVSIYPVPANDQLSVQIKNEGVQETVAIKIFNTAGSMVMTTEHSYTNNADLKLDVSSLATGVYQLVVEGALSYQVERVLIAR